MYEAEDGELFSSKEECQKHEAKLILRGMQSGYFWVGHNMDCTEGRGYYKRAVVEVYCQGLSRPTPAIIKNLLEEWCFKQWGRVAWIQGVQPVPAWNISDAKPKDFMNQPNGDSREGIQTTYKMRLILSGRELIRT